MITISDGSIKIDIDVNGKKVEVASGQLDNLEKTAKGVGKETEGAEKKTNKFVKSLGLVAVGAAAFNLLRKSLDGAIKRFDTLNTFPKVLQSLGASAEDSERAISNLSEGVDGLPTKLDDIAANAQRMYNSFKDVDKTTDTALALNNALLASGSSGEQAARGTDQYIKALQTGKVQMDTWNTLQETMGIGLTKLAEEFGYVGNSAENDLYQALKSGEIHFDTFNNKLIELGTGTGELAELARTNSLGIGTSFENLRSAATIGLAGVIEAFNNLSKEVTGKDIAQNIDSLKMIIRASFKVIVSTIEKATPVVKGFASVLETIAPVVNALTPALVGLASAYAIHSIILTTTAALKANATIMAIATAAQSALAIATNASALSFTVHSAQMAANGLILAAYNKMVAITTAAQALLSTGMTLTSLATLGLSGAVHVLNVAIKVLLGPIGWVTLAIGALVGAVVGIVKWFKRGTEEGKRIKEETEAYGESVDKLNDSLNDSADAYKDQRKETDAVMSTNKSLANQIDTLSRKENKSAADKQKLASYISQLNGQVEGLSLAYDAEADSLNMSSEQLKDRIGLMGEAASYTDAMERQLQISQEQQKVVASLNENNAMQDEYNQLLADGTIKQSEYDEEMAKLIERKGELEDANIQLVENYKTTEQEVDAAMAAISEAVANGAASQIVSMEMLSEENQQLVEDMKATWEEYYDAATDMFDRLSDKSTLTAEEMAENLEENQRVISEWAEGIATLAERGVNEGLLNTLRDAGPESAGHVKALVNASDSELERLSALFEGAADSAMDGFTTAFDIEKEGVIEVVGHLVTDVEKTLTERVKAANFHEIGIDIASGQAKGIREGTSEAEDAARDMADSVTKTTEDAFGIQSPSKVFQQIGSYVTEGFEVGIDKGTASVLSATKKLALETLKPFDGVDMEFQSIGLYAMAGFNRGLNAGSGIVMATARRIANQAAYTMKQALQIKSPSRLFEKEIGAMIPAGITLGIEDNAKSVFSALDAMSGKMFDYVTPEVALAAFPDAGLRHSTTTSNVVNNVTNTTNNSSGGTVEATFEVDGKSIAVATAPYMSKELGDMQKRATRKKGW